MEMSPLSSNLMHLFNSEPVKTAVERYITDNPDKTGDFSNIFKDAFETTTATDKTDKGNSLEILMGESDDLSGVLIDLQKAELSLQLTLQIRNKIIDAYNEVIKMSV